MNLWSILFIEHVTNIILVSLVKIIRISHRGIIYYSIWAFIYSYIRSLKSLIICLISWLVRLWLIWQKMRLNSDGLLFNLLELSLNRLILHLLITRLDCNWILNLLILNLNWLSMYLMIILLEIIWLLNSNRLLI